MSPRKIIVETLRKLLGYPNQIDKSSHPLQFEDDNEMCELCSDCYTLIGTMEQIKSQISLLEEEIESKIKQIHATILHTSSQLINNGDYHPETEKIIQIRTMLLRFEIGGNHQNFEEDEAGVKVELIQGDVDPLRVVGDQFLYENDNDPCFPTSVENIKNEEEPDDNFHDEKDGDDDTDFCIIPFRQNMKSRRSKKIGPSIRKRKIDSPSATENIPLSKRIKFGSSSRRTRSRSSPRIKTQTTLVNNNLVLSVKNIRPTSKKRLKKPSSTKKSSPTSNQNLGDRVQENDASQFPHKNDALSGIPCPAEGCTATFCSTKARNAHLRYAHEHPYQCHICTKKFLSQGTLAAHKVIRHESGDKKFSCGKCEKSFCLEENFERHVTLHEVEGVKPEVCDVCDTRFRTKEQLDRHMETHNRGRFQCQNCGKKCRDITDLDRHERTHKKAKPQKCPQCSATFTDGTSMKRHIVRDHSSSSAPQNICYLCGKGFYLPVDLKMHLDRHDGTHRQVKCDTCSEIFVTSKSLQAHRIRLHGEDPFVCDECGRTFTTMAGLDRHKKVHAGDKQHKCDTCGSTFISAYQLTTHVRSHTGERPYPCPHCDKAFRTNSNLIMHVKGIHTPGYVTPTPHKCPHCGKAFNTAFVLRGHVRRVHTGERPFICDQCAKAFAVKADLTQHLKAAHDIVLETRKNMLPRSKRDAFKEDV
ncbi:putative zinc finger protein 66 [Folsomia candida]|uniref:Putative zinc finger protein 66 n=1 Tax=Folsomia candida TaxID=158441 RepID=A0A226D5W4_FOLCA|nr:putative zinc finger protein 66 [Folsomia candida]